MVPRESEVEAASEMLQRERAEAEERSAACSVRALDAALSPEPRERREARLPLLCPPALPALPGRPAPQPGSGVSAESHSSGASPEKPAEVRRLQRCGCRGAAAEVRLQRCGCRGAAAERCGRRAGVNRRGVHGGSAGGLPESEGCGRCRGVAARGAAARCIPERGADGPGAGRRAPALPGRFAPALAGRCAPALPGRPRGERSAPAAAPPLVAPPRSVALCGRELGVAVAGGGTWALRSRAAGGTYSLRSWSCQVTPVAGAKYAPSPRR